MNIMQVFKDILDCKSGATAIEYGLIASLIVISLIGAMNLFADSAIGMWEHVSSSVETSE